MVFEKIEIDEDACAAVMAQHGFSTRQQAVNYALRKAVVIPMTIVEAKAMRGTGWDGDLADLRRHDR